MRVVENENREIMISKIFLIEGFFCMSQSIIDIEEKSHVSGKDEKEGKDEKNVDRQRSLAD